MSGNSCYLWICDDRWKLTSMAVCLATTTGDTVDDDHIVELVREDDEVCFLDSAVITSYSPLSFHLQLNARSNFRDWLESRLNSPAAGIYLARCARKRRCDRCAFASQITCEASHSPLCLACIQGTELYCSTFFRNPQGWAGMTFEDSGTGRELKKPIPEIREWEGN